MVNKEWNLIIVDFIIIVDFTLQLLATSWQTPTFTGYFKFTEKEASARMRNYISPSLAGVLPVCVYCLYYVYFCLYCLQNH